MNIREHPLAWRWTDPKYTILPDDVLARMQPPDQREIELWEKKISNLIGPEGLVPAAFKTIQKHNADISLLECRSWLQGQQPNPSLEVFVFWDKTTALRTTWGIVMEYWDDFFYPSSDNAYVWPETLNWMLAYFHEEQLQFGWK